MSGIFPDDYSSPPVWLVGCEGWLPVGKLRLAPGYGCWALSVLVGLFGSTPAGLMGCEGWLPVGKLRLAPGYGY